MFLLSVGANDFEDVYGAARNGTFLSGWSDHIVESYLRCWTQANGAHGLLCCSLHQQEFFGNWQVGTKLIRIYSTISECWTIQQMAMLAFSKSFSNMPVNIRSNFRSQFGQA